MSAGEKTRRRGEPLAVLVLLLAGWSGARLALWESPFANVTSAALPQLVRVLSASPETTAASPRVGTDGDVFPQVRESMWERAPAPLWNSAAADLGLPDEDVAVIPEEQTLASPGLAGGHQIMFMAALAQLPLPPVLAAALPTVPAPASPLVEPKPLAPPSAAPPLLSRAISRWSGDGWVLWRPGGSLAAASGQASYGGSQAGSVLRFSLAPSSARLPQAYARISRALSFSEQEAAVGLAARPIPSVPVRLLAEGRVQRSGDRARVRPAASLVTELPPQPLPLGIRAEAYAQAGYVGGRDGTPFFDAHIAADRPAAEIGPGELRVGGGIWAGGQKGASRLDIGPRASVSLGLGDSAATRLALDWRLRVAGDAEPGTGPALTLSAGF